MLERLDLDAMQPSLDEGEHFAVLSYALARAVDPYLFYRDMEEVPPEGFNPFDDLEPEIVEDTQRRSIIKDLVLILGESIEPLGRPVGRNFPGWPAEGKAVMIHLMTAALGVVDEMGYQLDSESPACFRPEGNPTAAPDPKSGLLLFYASKELARIIGDIHHATAWARPGDCKVGWGTKTFQVKDYVSVYLDIILRSEGELIPFKEAQRRAGGGLNGCNSTNISEKLDEIMPGLLRTTTKGAFVSPAVTL